MRLNEFYNALRRRGRGIKRCHDPSVCLSLVAQQQGLLGAMARRSAGGMSSRRAITCYIVLKFYRTAIIDLNNT